MKIEMLRWFLPVVIAAIIPVFFIAIYLNSRRQRVNQSEKRKAEEAESRTRQPEGEP